MPAQTVVRATIDEDTKTKAAEVLSEMGLTVSDAVRMLLGRIARDRALPFDPVPNALTAETLQKSARGEDVHGTADAQSLFEELGI